MALMQVDTADTWARIGKELEVPALPDGTLAHAFVDAVALRGERVALRSKHLGLWRAISWQEYGERVRWIGTALIALGFAPGDRACIIGNNCAEWFFADVGVICVGGISVGIYTTDSADQIAYVVNDCQCRIFFAEDEEQLDKILQVRDRTPSLERIVVFDMEGLSDFRDPMVVSLADLLELGRTKETSLSRSRHERVAAISPEDTAILIYTSGTTGPPKGAMLSHRNLLFQAAVLDQVMPVGPRDDQLSFLPLSHIAERLLSVFRPIFSGSVINFAENQETVPENIREISPTIFFAVPRIWEKFYSRVTIAAEEGTRVERQAFATALAIGHRTAEYRLNGTSPPWLLRAAHWLAHAIVLDRIKKFIGMERAKYVVTGAAPISPDLIKWYFALGLDMREAYGLTETAGVVSLPPGTKRKVGTVGTALLGTEIRLSEHGEILVRGPHIFKGYWQRPEKTAEALIDGWLHTGDVGVLDDEGFLRVIDRMKDIIITAGGKNISPSEIENQLKFSPYIADAIIIGDARKYLSCLIMIDHDNVAEFAQRNDIPFTNFTSLCRAHEVTKLVQNEIDKVNAKFSRVEQIKKFSLIDVQLTPEDEELTPTMKLKRRFVNERYKSLIECMYESS